MPSTTTATANATADFHHSQSNSTAIVSPFFASCVRQLQQWLAAVTAESQAHDLNALEQRMDETC